MAVNPQDVVDTADAQTLQKEGELSLRILAKLDALVRCADDICLAQELVRGELPTPDSNSGCDATVIAEVLAVLRTSPILHWGDADIVDDFCLQWVPLRSDSGIGNIEVLQRGQHQDWVARDVVHVPLIRQASVSSAAHVADHGFR